MKIVKATYIENGYFVIKYDKLSTSVIQDIGSIKMTVPTSPIVKDILQFLRKIKLEKLTNQGFDELEYRDKIIYENYNYEIQHEKLLKSLLDM